MRRSTSSFEAVFFTWDSRHVGGVALQPGIKKHEVLFQGVADLGPIEHRLDVHVLVGVEGEDVEVSIGRGEMVLFAHHSAQQIDLDVGRRLGQHVLGDVLPPQRTEGMDQSDGEGALEEPNPV